MKHKTLVITALILFLLVNTSTYWEDIGVLIIPVSFILIIVFIILVVAWLLEIAVSVKEKFSNKGRTLTVILLAIFLSLIYIFPDGLISFDRWRGNALLVAQREGVANCMSTIVLKEDNKFIERDVCFSLTEISGDYKFKNDTIYFENVRTGRNEDGFYQFAVIKPSMLKTKNSFDLIRYKDKNDTVGNTLWIIKNELKASGD